MLQNRYMRISLIYPFIFLAIVLIYLSLNFAFVKDDEVANSNGDSGLAYFLLFC